MITTAIKSVTTASDGTATAYTEKLTGTLVAVHYVKTDFADGVDFDITGETFSQEIWNEDNVNAADTVYPVRTTNTTLGVTIADAYSRISIYDERIKIAIAQGGDTKTGTFHFILEV